MKRFKFPLEKLLTFREDTKRAVERELAGALAALRLAETHLSRLEAEVAGRLAKLAEVAGRQGELDLEEVGRHTAYLRWLESRVPEARMLVERAAGQVEAVRGRLIEARRELRVVERLRERAVDRHQAEGRRAEQVDADEHAVDLHVRRGREQRG